MQGSAILNGVFELREGVSEEEFVPTLKAFYEHFIELGFAFGYRILRCEALEGFGKTLPAFKYRGALIYPNMEREQAAYECASQDGTASRCARTPCYELEGKAWCGLLCGDLHRL
jgi:hypothetical protein